MSVEPIDDLTTVRSTVAPPPLVATQSGAIRKSRFFIGLGLGWVLMGIIAVAMFNLHGAQRHQTAASSITAPTAATDVAPTMTPAPAPTAVDNSIGASSARSAANKYWSTWSSVGDSSGGAVRALYATQITFYGKQVSLDKVMRDKADFAKRWPIRTYTPVPNSISVTCYSNGACDVTGLVGWICKDLAGLRRSTGTAQFSFTLENGLITAESGSVVSRNFTR
jgi:hypothetical protein